METSSTPLHIAHLYANNENLGDWGSAEGIKLILKNELKEVIFEDFFLSFRDLTDTEIAHINACDLVIIGGGGLLYPRSKGLLLRLSHTSLLRIKKPIILYAVGLNYETVDEAIVEPYLTRFSETASLFASILVRDTMTQDALKRHEITSDIVVCPSMFLSPIDESFLLPKSSRTRVGIVPISLERFVPTQRNNYLASIESLICTHKDRYDFFLIGHNRHIHGVDEVVHIQTNIPILNPINPWQLMRAYHQMDVFVGSRGHMGIFAAGAKKPFLFLSYNVKCDAFTELIGYPPEFTIAPELFTPAHVAQQFDLLTENTSLTSLLAQKHDTYEHATKNSLSLALAKAINL